MRLRMAIFRYNYHNNDDHNYDGVKPTIAPDIRYWPESGHAVDTTDFRF
jgi:hypothetical protein